MSHVTARADLYQGLDEAQRRAVQAGPGPLVIIAGAGSGKTTTLVRRVAHLVAAGHVAPREVLALSHTTKAAAEIGERLKAFDEHLGEVHCHTVHAAAWKIVRRFSGEQYEILSSIYPVVRDALGAAVGSGKAREQGVLADVVAEIEWATARCLSARQYTAAAKQARRTPPIDLEKVAETWERYAAMKQARGLLDFADVLEKATALLVDPATGERVRSVWRALVVDEFQDTDLAQFRFLDALRAGRPLWTVVGDPRQTIYTFKGADASLLEEASKEVGVTVVHLAVSYRCSQQVLDAANRLIGTSYGPALTAVHDGPAVSVRSCANDEDEVARVVAEVGALAARGVPYEQMAVLYRFNSSSPRFEAAFTEAGIPYQMTGSERFFDRADVRAVLVPFGKAAREDPQASAVEILRSCATKTGWAPDAAPAGTGAARTRWEMVQALIELAERTQAPNAGALLERFLFLAKTGGGVGVTLGTIHAAKGLEWEAVCVTGCVEGQLPSVYAKTASEIEEERRLLYVAVTRAKKHLVLTYPRMRFKRPADVSRFLSVIGVRQETSGARKQSSPHPKNSAAAKKSVSFSSAAVDRAVEEAFNCKACGRRLTGVAARSSKACSGGCLSGELRRRWDALVVWREALAGDLGEHADEVITDSALFRFTVTGSTGIGWRPAVPAPSL